MCRITRFTLVVLLIFKITGYLFAQDGEQQSIPTLELTDEILAGLDVEGFTDEDIKKLKGIRMRSTPKVAVEDFKNRIDKATQNAEEVFDIGGRVSIFGNIVNPLTDIAASFNPNTAAGAAARNLVDKWFHEDDDRRAANDRGIAITKAMDQLGKDVIEACGSNTDCIDKVYAKVKKDQQLQQQLNDAGKSGALEEQETRSNNEATSKEAKEDQAKVTAAIEKFTNAVGQADEKNKQNGETIAKLADLEQKRAIALNRLSKSVHEKLDSLQAGQINMSGQLVELQNTSDLLLESVKGIDTTLIAMRKEQLDEKIRETFEKSTLSKKIEQLKDTSSAISKLYKSDSAARLADLAAWEALKMKQDVLNVCNIITAWGPVGIEALSTFCKDCPEEVAQSINLGLALTDIVGNVVTGNPGNLAKAAMTALGLFKTQEPGPELRMLQQITKQLNSLEKNMNQQFQDVHQHLFAMEENMVDRLDLIDQNIYSLSEEVFQMRTEIYQGLSALDSKSNYIINQNACTQNLILEIFKTENKADCKRPVAEFKKKLQKNEINSFQDLNNFFEGFNCSSCIKALLDAHNQDLLSSPLFQYSQCDFEGQDNKARPDRIYSFLYQVLGEEARNKATVNSILYIPANVRLVDSLRSIAAVKLVQPIIELNEQDRVYRNYKYVLNYADYVMTMFSFLELYNEPRLKTLEEIRNDPEFPGFTRDRTQKLIEMLEETLTLINHTIFQQSLMTGNGILHNLDEILAEGAKNSIPGDAIFSLSDAFTYNPYLRKNYSSYILDRNIGYTKLRAFIIKDGIIGKTSRISLKGYNMQYWQDMNHTILFQVSLTDEEDPNNHTKIFDCHSPIDEKILDEETYLKSLEFSFPSSIVELVSMKKILIDKLAEMNVIASPSLDAPNADFSREDLRNLIRLAKLR